MKDKVSELIDYLNKNDMKVFEELTSSKKVRMVYNNFVSYYNYIDKAYKAKSETDRDRFALEQDRFFSLALKQVNLLNNQEKSMYLKLVHTKLQQTLDKVQDFKVVDKMMLFGTIVRQLPKDINEEDTEIKNSIENMFQELNNRLEINVM